MGTKEGYLKVWPRIHRELLHEHLSIDENHLIEEYPQIEYSMISNALCILDWTIPDESAGRPSAAKAIIQHQMNAGKKSKRFTTVHYPSTLRTPVFVKSRSPPSVRLFAYSFHPSLLLASTALESAFLWGPAVERGDISHTIFCRCTRHIARSTH